MSGDGENEGLHGLFARVLARAVELASCFVHDRDVLTFARMQGGSLSSSAIGLQLATMTAPSRVCESALRASASSLAFSPQSDQLS